MTDYYSYDAGLPCKNPHCHSYGHPHPNCQCWAGSEHHEESEYAKGGSVCAVGKPHLEGCEYYADGGDVQRVPEPSPLPPDDIHKTLGMAGVHHGLLGLLKNVGHSRLSDPEKHAHVLHDLKAQHEWAKTPDAEPLKKRLGNRLALHLQSQDHDQAAELIQGHPLVGSTSKGNLKPILHRMAHPLMNQEPSPEAVRSSVDYLHSSIQGQSALDERMSRMLGAGKVSEATKEDKGAREKLKEHLESIRQNPDQMLEMGGSLGHYLPDHSAALACQAARAVQYLDGLKPMTQQLAPLDTAESVDKMAEASYDRQIDIAQNPLLTLQHIQDGTLQPQDLTTVETIYPGLHKAMIEKATEQLIETKTKNIEIPYKQKMSMSMLLGQPLDFTQSVMAAQAIIKSGIPTEAPLPQAKGKKRSGATAAELKQINKVDEMYETPLEARQINRNSH